MDVVKGLYMRQEYTCGKEDAVRAAVEIGMMWPQELSAFPSDGRGGEDFPPRPAILYPPVDTFSLDICLWNYRNKFMLSSHAAP